MNRIASRRVVRLDQGSLFLRSSKILLNMTQRAGYHSYPDASDKGSITSTTAASLKIERQLKNKNTQEFKVDGKFKLDKVFPGIPKGKNIADQPVYKTHHTVLDNALTVASQDMPGMMTSFAYIVRTGSAFENQGNSGMPGDKNTGSTQIIELASFKSTKNRKHQDLLEEVEKLGGMIQCISTRENIMYCIDVLRENAEAAMDILADAVLDPLFTEEEVEEAKLTARLMIDEMPSDALSRDAAHMAAYKGFPLGNSHFCPEQDIDIMTVDKLKNFHRDFYVGKTSILAAAGIAHDDFVQLATKRFGAMPKESPDTDALSKLPPSQYVGGIVKSQRSLKEPYVKISMGFEVGGWHHDDIVAVVVLNQLLGGGSSFSAGGPGKGMYTRLYQEVLNQYHWAESIESFMSITDDVGIVGIDAACAPQFVPNVIRVIVDQMVRLAISPVSDIELSRAKNMAKSMMLMQLESRITLCEDIARQYLTYGERRDPKAICDKIDKIDATDLMVLADKFLNYAPSISAVGHDLQFVPEYEDVKKFTAAYVKEGRRLRGEHAT